MVQYKRLKDPIYGYISVPMDYMVHIVDTDVFQRLRRIIQTSYAPLYSSAVHNRFVHSLGVFHLGSIVGEQFASELKQNVGEEFLHDIGHMKEVFLLACLLHDVGHAPFSHTGEEFYLDGEGENRYDKIHAKLKSVVGLQSFGKDVPTSASKSAAPHEIMSAIVGIEAFSKYFKEESDRDFFARCITGYQYLEANVEAEIKNCFISLLNSNVIDVDKLDYLIRDAYITGFQTVSIDYARLLKAATVVVDNDSTLRFAYYKDAVSVIENVVYAHDAEKKWIQNHPVVLYEGYILKHVFQHLSQVIGNKEQKLFSSQSLSSEGQFFENGVRVSLLCDDDIIYLMKNIFPCELGNEFFDRNARRHPLWKSEPEYEALFSGSIGGRNDSISEFEQAMNATASYLAKTSDTWKIDEEALSKIEQDLQNLDNSPVNELTREIQRKDKKKVQRLMKCLLDYARQNKHECDFVVLEASQFNSGFGKPDFSNIPIVFNTSSTDYVECEFGKIAKPLKAEGPEREKFYYLFYRRQRDKEIDKKELCEFLAREFTTLRTYTRRNK
ncbi:MAG: HD domain-containing protein [Muribaculaceae bacterium]|nr:HD domain-containing protein [Roseburia sp.]MCM1431356.1 HD domain-containing protein [Muribaculaceae bacterium]MCM1491798.1 HD domain-containing protein [Muribaculaceae bacterium]